jgi:CRISPR/Cas system-associated protein Cas5 (RAMP superfamily)
MKTNAISNTVMLSTIIYIYEKRNNIILNNIEHRNRIRSKLLNYKSLANCEKIMFKRDIIRDYDKLVSSYEFTTKKLFEFYIEENIILSNEQINNILKELDFEYHKIKPTLYKVLFE